MKTLKVILQEVVSGLKSWVNTSTVHKTGNETINGVKTFSDGIVSDVTGSATSVPWTGVTEKPADYPPASHTHGNITNDGKVGTTANKPLITGTGGVVQAGSFGNSANTFCEGNDSRLSDAWTPVAHTHGKADITDLFNSNFIPSANNSYNLGSSSYQWNNLYAKNYYYNGTAWGLDKINAWTNFNRINGYRLEVKSSSQEIGVIPSSNQWNGFQFTDKNNTNTLSFEHGFLGSGETRFKISMVDNFASHDSGSTVWIEFLRLTAYAGGSGFIVGAELRPLNNNLNLGTSTNKWKTFNGINPGALSLPVTALNNTYDISGDITDLTGGNNSITAARTGWIFVKSDNATEISIENTITGMGASDHSATAATLMVSIPVTSGETLNIIANCTSIDKAYLLPCQGNV